MTGINSSHSFCMKGIIINNKYYIAAIIAVGLLLVSYISSNIAVPITGENTVIRVVHSVFPSLSKEIPDSVICIDVSHDKQLIPAIKNREPIGNSAITDRQTLLTFLSTLKNQGDYKYILLDVAFLEGESTPYDSLLFSTIASMDRIVCARSSQFEIADSSLLAKSGYADYYTSLLNTDFCKYIIYTRKGDTSLAAKAYEEITNRSITNKMGLFWFENNSLSRRVFTPFLVFSAESTSTWKQLNHKSESLLGRDLKRAPILTLGEQALKHYIPALYRDKIIVVGSFNEDDNHTTYRGSLAGPLIHLNALHALLAKEHLFPIWYILVIFVFFYMLALSFLLSQRKEKNAFVVIWTKKSVIIFIFVSLSYIVFHRTIDVFITTTILSSLEYILGFMRKH